MNKLQKITCALSGICLTTLTLAGCSNTPTQGHQTSNQPNTSTSGKTVTIGYVDWDEDVAASYLWKDILTEKGYSVQLQSLDAGPLFSGLSEGGVDVFFDTWLPVTHQTYMTRYGSNLANLGKWYQGQTQEGFAVPSYVTDVTSIGDLKKHAAEFGNQIVGIDPGAGEMQLAAKAVSDYGLGMQLVQSSSPAMLSALQKAYSEHKPIVVTMWSPHWAVTKYHLKYLSDPKGDFGKPGWIQTEANKNWASSNAQVSQWIKNFKLTPQQLGSLEEDINSGPSKDQGVKKWISDNQNLVNSWLK
ncbi:glycine betaine ABC transporter substrate-binding protein [Alicyclobacillus pomorum]|jgi:glycine betaine/proline transport system substrate-binding protein|uniref:glycine betaine ABC transporter substrate-binding protein n=1 Tax=Alicyclobacillus pomorum TaxID=204470 RepID=UPI0004033638|nr:glycine betaine ABC transporter substrate-binding protein [Alicyclobacillus pomorum]